jgi:methylated-DNA-[protein]-cysteine S-methyltransferase
LSPLSITGPLNARAPSRTIRRSTISRKQTFEIEQLQAYFVGELREFALRLEFSGTPFQCRVWNALRSIPYGETRSYGDIAEQIGSPTAYRAVGLANGHNPIAVIVPCHRVIGANGSLTGFGGGLNRKRLLLDLEQQSSHLMLFD